LDLVDEIKLSCAPDGSAAIGYKEMEFAGYFGHSPKDVRAILDKNGLTSPSSHESYDTVEKKLPETLEGAHVIGQTFLVCPYIDEKMRTADGYKRVVETFNKVGEASKKAGIQFAYHNHYWEFIPDAQLGGKFPYDFLLESTDANNVKMEMDLCWISVAGIRLRDIATRMKTTVSRPAPVRLACGSYNTSCK